MYKIPVKTYRFEEVIKKSKFITTIAHTPTEESAKEFIAKIKNEFSDASHNCWAYIAGIPGDTAKIGMSDDGEPHGTAGKPILSILLHSEIVEITAVVTRYFGGIKLGTGGLVRAYSGSVKNALENIETKEKADLIQLTIVSPYSQIDTIKNIVESFTASILEESYTSEASFHIELAQKEREAFIQSAQNATRGELLIRKQETGNRNQESTTIE